MSEKSRQTHKAKKGEKWSFLQWILYIWMSNTSAYMIVYIFPSQLLYPTKLLLPHPLHPLLVFQHLSNQSKLHCGDCLRTNLLIGAITSNLLSYVCISKHLSPVFLHHLRFFKDVFPFLILLRLLKSLFIFPTKHLLALKAGNVCHCM